ncbi:MAG TPA: hypothetical protein VND87_00980 [Stellaceae bacterium]|nr:hypothetical protein [Stellaceae bacterium]
MRLPLFALVLLGAGTVVGFASVSQGALHGLLDAVIAIVVLQVGYAAGIGVRAGFRAWRRHRRSSEAVRSDRTMGYSTGDKC